jgi:hypothetical protein
MELMKPNVKFKRMRQEFERLLRVHSQAVLENSLASQSDFIFDQFGSDASLPNSQELKLTMKIFLKEFPAIRIQEAIEKAARKAAARAILSKRVLSGEQAFDSIIYIDTNPKYEGKVVVASAPGAGIAPYKRIQRDELRGGGGTLKFERPKRRA